MSDSRTPGGRRAPLITVVSACYDVESFLPAFIGSVDAQTLDPQLFEVVMVDDGSRDETGRLLDEWAARRPDLVRVVHQANGGQGAARNTGIEHAAGDWLTFPDPDDRLAPDYLANVVAFIDRHPPCDMVAASRWILDDATGESTDTHPLRHHFGREGRRNLAVRDEYFHGGAPSAFLRRERLLDTGLRFDTRVRPNFEDGHFCARYLLQTAEPQVGFVSSAVYHYRKRSDGTSTLQTALSNPGRYTDVLRHGYLDLLQRAAQEHGRVPLWLQNFVIYELTYYVGREDAELRGLAPRHVREEFHLLMREITARLDPVAVRTYRSGGMRPLTRELLQHAWKDERWVSDEAEVLDHDVDQDLVKVVYRYTGPEPTERVVVGERQVVPHAAKTREVVVQDRVVMHERILWLPSRRLRIEVDGRPLLLAVAPAERPTLSLSPALLSRLDGAPAVPAEPELTRAERAVLRSARGRRRRELYRDAWVLMDRVHDADDSAEHLFAFLRHRRPAINAWFVVAAGTPAYERLRAAHGRRVVAHGTDEWKALLLNARLVISSHADLAVTDPPEMKAFGPRGYRFAFLQHGVIKDDLSGWLNHRNLDLFVTSTQPEYDSVAGDHNSYRYTSKETVLTGLPRFDRLFRAGRRFPPEQRDLLLISPTWRDSLVAPLEPGQQRRFVRQGILESDYMKAWLGFITSPEVAEAAERHGVQVAVLPHPNMQSALDLVELPAHVRRLSFDSELDVREVFARAAVLVTDYSSTAFNAAYIRRPVVYYQFDADAEGARHVGRAGYFDYERDGFGPVTHHLEAAVAEVVATLDHGREPRSPWAERAEQTFPFHDDRNCARVVAALRETTRRRRTVFLEG